MNKKKNINTYGGYDQYVIIDEKKFFYQGERTKMNWK
jgi:hypothetical protein